MSLHEKSKAFKCEFCEKCFSRKDKSGWTPLHFAARYGHVEIVKILAPLCENLDLQNEFGRTLLHFAAINRHVEVVKILAPLCKYLDLRNSHGKTALDLAKKRRKTAVLDLSKKKRTTEVIKFLKNLKKSIEPPSKRIKVLGGKGPIWDKIGV